MGPIDPRPWHGTVLRHIPAGALYGPLDVRFAGRSRESRWNLPGEPTLVFANDRDTLMREFTAHLTHARNPSVAPHVQPRQIVACDIRLERVFDLTEAATLASLGIQDAPACFLDRAVARATAGFLRHVRQAHGILVPSLAGSEPQSSWNLVVFLDQLPGTLDDAIVHTAVVGTISPHLAVGD